MTDDNERMRILEMIDSGQISAEEGLRLLQALVAEQPAEPTELRTAEEPMPGEAAIPLMETETPTSETTAPSPPPSSTARPEERGVPGPSSFVPGASSPLPPEAEKWRHYWYIPLWIGVGVTILGGFLMYWAQQASGLGFWFVCSSLWFALGVLILALAASSRTAPWIHLRVQQSPGEWPQRIAFSFPIPVRLTVWLLRVFGHRVPKLEETSLDEIILALGKTTSPDNPVYIQVDEGEDGEKVEIFIG
jgi:hypothetical protein